MFGQCGHQPRDGLRHRLLGLGDQRVQAAGPDVSTETKKVFESLELPFERAVSKVANVEFRNWDRCYDFKNIFAEKFSKFFWVFCSNYC
jgi:hypothetical protein